MFDGIKLIKDLLKVNKAVDDVASFLLCFFCNQSQNQDLHGALCFYPSEILPVPLKDGFPSAISVFPIGPSSTPFLHGSVVQLSCNCYMQIDLILW